MGSFGGTVKLTGESEYRKALQNITQGLKLVSSELKVASSGFDGNEKSVDSSAEKSKELSDALSKQKDKIRELESSLKTLTIEYNNQKTTHEKIQSEYDNEKKKLEEIGRTLGTSSDEYKEQEQKVLELSDALSKSDKSLSANETSLSRMTVQLNNAKVASTDLEGQIKDLGDSAEESGEKAEVSTEGFTALKWVIADLASKAVDIAIDSMKKLGEKVVEVGKLAYENYGDYEQLVGGVETLFKDSADVVVENAKNAYKTAGISANDYMEQATSFSASLLQSLSGDTKAAADYADMAMIDMSDNANKMGTDISSLQNAYQGFAKANYTIKLMSAA